MTKLTILSDMTGAAGLDEVTIQEAYRAGFRGPYTPTALEQWRDEREQAGAMRFDRDLRRRLEAEVEAELGAEESSENAPKVEDDPNPELADLQRRLEATEGKVGRQELERRALEVAAPPRMPKGWALEQEERRRVREACKARRHSERADKLGVTKRAARYDRERAAILDEAERTKADARAKCRAECDRLEAEADDLREHKLARLGSRPSLEAAEAVSA
jgi:hypothetical protein